MGKYCTGWIDKIGSCDWSEVCKQHDDDYMTTQGKNLTKLQADVKLFKGVFKVCKPMAVVMWLGLTILPFSYFYWFEFRDLRV